VIREVADHDPRRYPEVATWPLAEALLAYEAHMIARAERAHQLLEDR
jgi:hypothetical protein